MTYQMSARFFICGMLLLLSSHAVYGEAAGTQQMGHAVHEGIGIDFLLQPDDIVEGGDAKFRFILTDSHTGTPLRGARPAAWVDSLPQNGPIDERACSKKVATLLAGSLLSRPALDLNSYYVLALNSDSTITVVDPLFGFGGTKLLAMVFLSSPGEDWVLTANQDLLFVSMPAAGAVAMIDTTTWKMVRTLPAGLRPSHLALQSDEKYMWVASERLPNSDGPGVIALTPAGAELEAQITTAGIPSALTLSEDNRYLFVASEEAGTVAVIDTQTLKRTASLSVGGRPSSIDFSPLSQLAYAADKTTGAIFAISGPRGEVVGRTNVETGVHQVRITPSGRLGFAVNPEKDIVQIFDVAVGKVIQTADITKRPDRVTFSSTLAYVRRQASAEVIVIPLDQVGKEGAAVPIVNFPGGQIPFGQGAKPSGTDSIVQAPGENAALVANSGDRVIYYYKEGMAAPMGSFQNYGKSPRAVLAVDRSLRERAPGIYESAQRLPRRGSYEVILFLNSPRAIHCFPITISADLSKLPATPPAVVRLLGRLEGSSVGQSTVIAFEALDATTGKRIPNAGPINVMVYLHPVGWQKRIIVKQNDSGSYEFEVHPPQPGHYYITFESHALGIKLDEISWPLMRVTIEGGSN